MNVLKQGRKMDENAIDAEESRRKAYAAERCQEERKHEERLQNMLLPFVQQMVTRRDGMMSRPVVRPYDATSFSICHPYIMHSLQILPVCMQPLHSQKNLSNYSDIVIKNHFNHYSSLMIKLLHL